MCDFLSFIVKRTESGIDLLWSEETDSHSAILAEQGVVETALSDLVLAKAEYKPLGLRSELENYRLVCDEERRPGWWDEHENAILAGAQRLLRSDIPRICMMTNRSLPNYLTSIGGDCYLSGYGHPLPAGLTSIGGDCHLRDYGHPLPAGLTSIGGDCHLRDYGHPLPAGLTSIGKIFR